MGCCFQVAPTAALNASVACLTRIWYAWQVCTASGLLVVAHQKGEVRVYQFSPDAQQVTCVHLDHSSKCVAPTPALPCCLCDLLILCCKGCTASFSAGHHG